MRINFGLKVDSFGIKSGNNIVTIIADEVKYYAKGLLVSTYQDTRTSICSFAPERMTINENTLKIHDSKGNTISFVIVPSDGKTLREALVDIMLLTGNSTEERLQYVNNIPEEIVQ